ncbi:hypothetical protein PGH07_07810 [Sulfurovum sp. zt1-1]|uniref:Uncharacterized protein n=1 Tax=Sulfurovum zhangzhouensis TaxID=3019067 RepID=A0ABT7QZ19_9BACT|nr:hypothetical protein [Sulfurovum zhangzhouensis]MDM5272082.1 hypothetical protein [Sulfurovum zhangzhouensis]
MQQLSEDLAFLYDEIGLDAQKQDGSMVKIIFDSGLSEVEESGMRMARALASASIERNAVVTVLGKNYKSMRSPEPYGDMDEEVIIALLEQS